MSTYYVGWDVGAWKCSDKGNSCDAIVWACDENQSLPLETKYYIGNIVERINNISMHNIVTELLEAQSTDHVYIAIDAALGWPNEFMLLLNNKHTQQYTPDIKNKCFDNRLLYRDTERDVYVKTGYRILPKSTVGDRIGGHSTKIISILKKGDAIPNKEGIWNYTNEAGGSITVFETYPTAVKHFISEKTLEGVFIFKKDEKRSDYIDAVYCLYIAYEYTKKTLSAPPPQLDASLEGWIWLPQKKDS